MGVYIYQNNSELAMQNAYIGEYGWKPGVNTVLYLPLNGDVVDYSTYNRSFTVYGASASIGTPIFDTLSNNKKVSKFVATGGASSNWFMFTNDLTDIPKSGDVTVSYWIRWDGQYTSGYQTAIAYRSDTNSVIFSWMAGVTNTKYIMFHGNNAKISSLSPTIGTRYNIINVVNNGQVSIYLNGDISTPIYSGAFSYGGGNPSSFCIGAFWADTQGTRRDEAFNGNLGDIIIENKSWTADEISDYYNLTKGNYGL